jgi:hypothetical protein
LGPNERWLGVSPKKIVTFPEIFSDIPQETMRNHGSVGIETWDILGHLGTLAWGVEYYPLVMTFTVRHG